MRLLLLVGTIVLIVLLVRSIVTGGTRRSTAEAGRATAGEELVRDPVCEKYLPRSMAVSARVGGETRLFCSDACAARFRETGGRV